MKSQGPSAKSCLAKAQLAVNSSFERYFFSHGKAVANNPVKVIVLCLIISLIAGIGLIRFQKEQNPNKLWIKQTSDFLNVYDWKQKYYPPNVRPHFVLFEGDNVLEKDSLLAMYDVHNYIYNINTTEKDYGETCKRMPKSIQLPFGRRKRSAEDKSVQERQKRQAGWFNIFNVKTDYCEFMESLDKECYFESILEVWEDLFELKSKSQTEIYDDINKVNSSAIFGRPLDVTTYLSGIIREGDKIVGAKAAMYVFVNNIDMKAVSEGRIFKDEIGLDYVVDQNEHTWEGLFIDAMEKYKAEHHKLKIYYITPSSLNRVSDETIFGDANYLAFGFLVEFIYVTIMLGKFNSVEQRPILAMFGLLCVGLSIIVSYGICSGFGVKYSPVCTILPFLLLGLGIDGMFVIMQAWNNLSYSERREDLETRVGCALKHAGVSITIASITNFMAFIIGCTSVLPGLWSFCLYTAIGIFCVFVFQCTLFTAWFTLDQRRLEKNKHCLFWCYKMKDWKPNQCSQRDICQSVFKEVIGRLLVLKPVKAFVILLALTMLGISGWRITYLRQELDLIWFVPSHHHMFKFSMKAKEYFSNNGEQAEVLFGKINYQKELPKLLQLGEKLRNHPDVGIVRSWADEFKAFIEDRGFDVLDPDLDDEQFFTELSEFLYSERGIYFRENSFKFNGTLSCLEKTPEVVASKIEINYKILDNTNQKLRAMNGVRNIIAGMNFSDFAKVYANIYAVWETDEVIEYELYRNLILAMIIVFLITLILMASWRASMMVLLCVLFTMIDLLGVMQLWGITIELTSATNLVLAVGLCVDYAAHVAHTFMTQSGTKDERLRATLANIGPAVFNGGVSTFLAFIFLATSDSHIFKTFFRCFLSVTVLGLFHGLIFLPVLLSLIGPEPHENIKKEDVMDIERLYVAHNGNVPFENGNVHVDNNNHCDNVICKKQQILHESSI